MKNADYNVDILVDGKPQKIHYYNGLYYVEGREDYEYSIKINNRSYNKILAIVSIDGLSVMDGQAASDDSGGYVIEPWQNYEIKGYRKDLNSVGAFKFSRKQNSYAKSKGNDAEKNCGVIGIRILAEKQKPAPVIIKEKEYVPYPVYPSYPDRNPHWHFGDPIGTFNGIGGSNTTDISVGNMMRSYNSSTMSDEPISSSSVMYSSPSFDASLQNTSTQFSLGSTWGQKVQSAVVETTFKRGNLVFAQDIYYSTRQDLINMGVPIIKEPKIAYPQSFPKSFCSPPSGWE